MYILYSIVQRVGAIEVLFAVVSQLRAKLMSTDRGQASEVTVDSYFLLTVVVLFRSNLWFASRML